MNDYKIGSTSSIETCESTLSGTSSRLVGQYHLVAYMLNSLGIEREAGLGGFGDE